MDIDWPTPSHYNDIIDRVVNGRFVLIPKTSCNINLPIFKTLWKNLRITFVVGTLKKKIKINMAKFKAPFDEKQFYTKIPKFKV